MRANHDDLAVTAEMPGFESRQTDWGDLTASLERISAPMDCTELFAKLPGGHCSCPHWGVVISGRVRVRYADREEVLNGGDAYYLAPGHVPVFEQDTVLVEFSPAEQLAKTFAALEG